MGRKVSGTDFPGEVLHGENLPEVLFEIIFICLTFSLAAEFLDMFPCNFLGQIFSGIEIVWEIFPWGESDFTRYKFFKGNYPWEEISIGGERGFCDFFLRILILKKIFFFK